MFKITNRSKQEVKLTPDIVNGLEEVSDRYGVNVELIVSDRQDARFFCDCGEEFLFSQEIGHFCPKCNVTYAEDTSEGEYKCHACGVAFKYRGEGGAAYCCNEKCECWERTYRDIRQPVGKE